MKTGNDLIKIFKSLCEESHKLFIPDSPRQESVADALVKHYDSNILEKSIAFYIKTRTGPFLVFDFAIESKNIADKVKFEEQAKDKVKDLVKQTYERLANE